MSKSVFYPCLRSIQVTVFLTLSLYLGSEAEALQCASVFSRVNSGEIQFLTEPLPLSLTLEVYGVSYPLGKDGGELYHVRPRSENVLKMKKLDGLKFQKMATEFNSTTADLYDFLGFKVDTDSHLGEYWSALPSSQLMRVLKTKWNEAVGDDPLRKIYVSVQTTGADPQIKMLKLWLDDFTIGIGDAYKGYEEFYIPTGKSIESAIEDSKKFTTDPVSKRINDQITIYMHDMGQITNSFYMPLEPLQVSQQVSEFYLQAFHLLKERNHLIPTIKDHDLVELGKLIDVYSKGKGNQYENTRKDGMDAFSVFRLYLYHSQRALHSITHIFYFLITHPEGLEPNKWRIYDRGSDAETESTLHLAGLGRKAVNSVPPGPSPFLVATWNRAVDTGKPVTLESALDYITNGDMQLAQEMVDKINDPELKKLFNKFVSKGAFDKVPSETLKKWADLSRKRYQMMKQ